MEEETSQHALDDSWAEEVEVKMKMYSCKACGIRYNTAEAMKQHYNEVHINAEVEDRAKISIKEEPVDDDDDVELNQSKVAQHEEVVDAGVGVEVEEEEEEDQEPTQQAFVLVDNSQIMGEDGQVYHLAQSEEDGQQVLIQVVSTDQLLTAEQVPEPAETVEETAQAVVAATPGRRGRKRKAPASRSSGGASSRPRRSVVPNIKSEFVYETPAVTGGPTGPIEMITYVNDEPAEDDGAGGDSGHHGQTKKIQVQIDATGINTVTELANTESMDRDYPSEYTPTHKTIKGRIRVPTEEDQAMRRFPCPFTGCNYVAKYRSNLWDHKKTHTGEKPYVCTWPSCSMRFSQTHQLKLHLRSHTGERPYVCEWPGCNSAFSQKPGLKSHMLTHTGEKPFKCDYPGCNWTFRLKGALTDHKRAIHEDAKKYICEWPGCNKRFLQQCHLKKHIMGHADIKPFSCDWPNCNYKAVTMAYVTNHRKTHTGEKNYECTYPSCNKRFVKSSHVNRHRQRCHPDLFVVVDGEDDGEEDDGEELEEVVDPHNSPQQDPSVVEAVEPPTTTTTTTTTPSTSAAGRRTRSSKRIMYKIANHHEEGGEEDEGAHGGEATIFIQQEDVEEEMVDTEGATVVGEDGVEYLNGSVNEQGQIIINGADGEPLMFQLSKKGKDADEEGGQAQTEETVGVVHAADQEPEPQTFILDDDNY